MGSGDLGVRGFVDPGLRGSRGCEDPGVRGSGVRGSRGLGVRESVGPGIRGFRVLGSWEPKFQNIYLSNYFFVSPPPYQVFRPSAGTVLWFAVSLMLVLFVSCFTTTPSFRPYNLRLFDRTMFVAFIFNQIVEQ